MNTYAQNLQWVVIECPYLQWENPEVRFWFNQFVQAKKDGFEKEYPKGVMPFNAYDFIGNLLMVVDKETKEPICVFKSTTQKTCSQFFQDFELNGLFKGSAYDTHFAATKKILAEAEKNNHLVGYNSSWTIHPRIRKDQVATTIAREMTQGLFYQYYTSFNIEEILIVGVVRFKVPEIQRATGFEDIYHEGKLLEPCVAPHLLNEQVLLQHLKKFSVQAEETAKKYQAHWDNRIEFRLQKDTAIKKAA